ncbi:hypothetical protein [Nitrososphaera sp.]|uniref:hypothetical protein n=1 Tax=Nitrososphaera sp. TaxID=1971748 RepID=UPI001854128C|nr:hypothetical protein [Nitrososphaera sp.]NWG37466.1 hypothetical protein [Nitrososphaera sp.]
MEQERTCVLCGESVDDSSLTFEQRLVEDEDFCAPCWNEIMHDVRDAPFSQDVKLPWAS